MNQSNLSLPAGCTVHPASAKDMWSIRLLVLSAKLDPTQLRWEQFWLIKYHQKLIACGQLRSFKNAQELGSLVVAPAWRNQHLGTILTQHLIQAATQPLYLECLGKQLVKFYLRLHFIPVSFDDLPPSMQQKFGLSQIGKKLIKLPVTFMHYPV